MFGYLSAMSPILQDSEYLKEVTSCLSQSLVEVVQKRPPDPIEFIAHYLINHRKLHPRPGQRREQTKKNYDHWPSTSATTPNTSHNNLNVDQVTIYDAAESRISNKNGDIVERRYNRDDEDGCVEDYFPHVTFVHQDYIVVGDCIGDLFDYDDFG